MAAWLAPVLAAVLAWWAGTIAVLVLGRIGERADGSPGRVDLLARSLAALSWVAAFVVVVVPSWHTTQWAAALSFGAGILLWGCLELSYFRGWITGPVKRACPPGVGIGRRFRLGVGTSLHHELTVLATAAMLFACEPEGIANPGVAAFVVLWLMRWSAKLNLFLGARNFNVEMLPTGLRYLGTYVHRAPMNPLWPVSVGGASLVLAGIVQRAIEYGVGGVPAFSLLLVATLLALAIIEHLLMVTPVTDRRLWAWAAPSGR